VKTVADTLDVSRSNLVEHLSRDDDTLPPVPPRPPDDDELLTRIRRITDDRGSYGYRRVTALLNRELCAECKPTVNHKRIYRVMRDHRLLLHRHTGKKPTRTHDGQVITLGSNTRWCSASFEIRCWSGEVVRVVFSLDTCDCECMRWRATVDAGITGELVRDLMVDTVEYRFGAGAHQVPHAVQWLSDNGSCYTGNETIAFGGSLGLLMCTTPPYSPESNGMAEAFVKTLRRDYVYLNKLDSGAAVLAQLSQWIDDYNEVHPHKGLKMRSPREYLRATAESTGVSNG
jgi:transposase InsO family protein